nr:glycosyltransferase family 4 protein [Shewanella marisflavi]
MEYDLIKKNADFFTVLFLGRVEEYKGIFIVLDTFKLLKESFPTLKLIIAGDGSSLKNCIDKVHEENILDVTFLGEIKGKEVADVYTNADLYILPSYSEGMPTSMLEAMAFGLPIITTPVGGIPDFFDTNNMGSLVDSREPLDFFIASKKYLDAPDEMKRISNFNKEYAQSHFLASAVALDIERKLESLFQGSV